MARPFRRDEDRPLPRNSYKKKKAAKVDTQGPNRAVAAPAQDLNADPMPGMESNDFGASPPSPEKRKSNNDDSTVPLFVRHKPATEQPLLQSPQHSMNIDRVGLDASPPRPYDDDDDADDWHEDGFEPDQDDLAGSETEYKEGEGAQKASRLTALTTTDVQPTHRGNDVRS